VVEAHKLKPTTLVIQRVNGYTWWASANSYLFRP